MGAQRCHQFKGEMLREQGAARREKGMAKSCVGMAKSVKTSPKVPFPCQKHQQTLIFSHNMS
jgi:hypothetical protein